MDPALAASGEESRPAVGRNRDSASPLSATCIKPGGQDNAGEERAGPFAE